MSNIRKSFSFRDGVQVDQDVFVVRGSLVGIGTSVPTEAFDVRGTAKILGLTTTTELMVSGISTFAKNIDIETVRISSGIITGTSPSGIVTYYGDARFLQGMPTSQWIDVDPGLGYTSIYASGNVGVSTNNPEYNFQVGGNPTTGGRGVGFNSTGSIVATGIVTARSFVGFGSGITLINASNISSGTISNDRLPTINTNRLPSNILVSGIITSNSASFQNITVSGNVTGIASTARSLTGNPSISVTDITALGSANISGTTTSTTFVGSRSIIGVSSVTNSLYVGSSSFAALSSGNVGIGTSIPTADLQIRKNDESSLEVISDSSQARISLGQVIGSNGADITFGATPGTLEISNNSTGDFLSYLHSGSSGVGTGNFGWIYGQTNQNLMTLTYDGKLGIGEENPVNTLEVVGTSTVTSDLYVGGSSEILGSISIGVGGNRVRFGSGQQNVLNNTNINTTAGISTISQLNVLGIGSIGIQTSRPIVGLDARQSTGLFQSVGIGTTQNPNELTVYGKAVITNGIGINTSQFYIDEVFNSDTGMLQIFDGGITVWNSGIVVRGFGGIGVGTNFPRCALDLGFARNPLNEASLFVPPYATSADLQQIGFAQPTGGMVFNVETGTYQYTLGDGTDWQNIGAWDVSSEWGVTLNNFYVGIGTTTPGYELEVHGTLGVFGQILVDGYIRTPQLFTSDVPGTGNGYIITDWIEGNLIGEVSNVNIGGTIAAPTIIADFYYGDGSRLTGIGISEDLGDLNITTTGIITAARFVGDGSGLINVPGGGGGGTNPLIIRDNGSLVGSAATLDFGNHLDVSPVIAGIVTITVNSNSVTPWIKISSGITTQSNVGIGTTLPTSKLHIVGDTLVTGVVTSNSISVGVGGSIITTNTSGLVGIGTTLPTSKLHIVGDTLVTGVVTATEFHGNLVGIATRLSPDVNSSSDEFLDIVFVTDNGTSSVTDSNLFSYNPNDGILRVDNAELSGLTSTSSLKVGAGGTLITASGSSVGIGSTLPTAALDIVGNIVLRGPNRVIDFIPDLENIDYETGIRFFESTITSPRMALDYNGDSNVVSSGQLEIKTYNNNTSSYDIAVVFDRLGRVGINKTNPSTNLDVVGSVAITGLTSTGSLDVGTRGSLFAVRSTGLVGVGTTVPRTKFEVVGDTNITGTTTSFLLNVGVGASILRTQSNGFVGIGSTVPTAKLDVLGNTNLRGNLGISSNLSVTGNSVFTGIVTASKFVGDGSLLTNLPLESGSITVLNTDTLIGVASAINFGGKIGVTSVSSGIVTVSVVGANVSISDIPPGDPEDGDLWFSSLLGRGFIYYIDDDSQQWVDFSPANSGIVTARTGGGETAWETSLTGIGTDANVGVGTTIPAYTLDVAGDINFTGTFYQNGSQFISSKWEEDSENRIYRMTNVGLGTTVPITPLQVERYGVKTGFGTFSASVGVTTDIDSFTISTHDFKTAEYTLHIENGTSVHSQKLLVIQTGTEAYSQEYAVMYNNNPVVSIGSTIDSGMCKVQVTPESGITGLTTYRFVRNTLI